MALATMRTRWHNDERAGRKAPAVSSAEPTWRSLLLYMLAWFFTTTFTVSAADRLADSLGGMNRETAVVDQMWSKGRMLYDMYHNLKRPDCPFSVATVDRVMKQGNSTWSLDISVAPDTCPGGYTFTTGTVQGAPGSPATPTEATTSVDWGAGRGTKRKRRRYRCSECERDIGGLRGFAVHLGKSPVCEEMCADLVEYNPAEEEMRETFENAAVDQYKDDMQSYMVDNYATLYYDNMVERTCIQREIKEGLVEGMVAKMKCEIFRRLAKNPEEHKTLEAQIGAVFDVHRGIETAAKEEGVLKAKLDEEVRMVEPVRRELIDAPDKNGKATGPRTGDFVYDVPIKEELKSMFAADPTLLEQLRAASDAWAAERPSVGSTRRVYVDIADGDVLRSHPHLGQSADKSDGAVRLAFILYYDDLEVVNPLGAFHGRHKLGMFYWALVNIHQSTRMAFHNLHLMTVALVSDIDYYGIGQIVSGLPGDTSFGSMMTELDAGITYDFGRGPLLVRGWCICLSADFPAAALCCGFKKSVSAIVYCRECDVCTHEDCYPCPNSFMEENTDLEQHHLLRELEEWEEQFAHFQTLGTAAERTAYLASLGINSFTDHAFGRVPHFDICRCVPYDFMHVELEGSLKNELAAMLYYFLRKRPQWKFSIGALNERMREFAWPGGYRPPTFTEGYLEKGTQGGEPKKGCHVHMTSGDVMVFVRHSIDLLLPLIGDTSDPVWQCWVAHVKYIHLLLQHSMTYEEILELDALIYDHHEQFIKVYGKRLFKPKNHFACHFPTDILNFGPVRHYWCMRFEALNQLFKTFAKTGSFRDTCKRCASFWTVKIARERSSGAKSLWGATRVVSGSLFHTYHRSEYTTGGALALMDEGFANVLGGLFNLLARQKVKLRWIYTLYHSGVEYFAGKSWLSATFNGQSILAHIPEHGMLEMAGNTFLRLQMYPLGMDADLNLPTTTVATTYSAEERIVKLESLSAIVPLWFANRIESCGEYTYRFVPLS